MFTATSEELWRAEDSQIKQMLEKKTQTAQSKRIHFYAPSFMHYKTKNFQSTATDFPTISVTGTRCSLKCKHCEGRVLNTMYPAKSPDDLFDLCKRLKTEGASGCLISGGCNPTGSVPISSFITSIARIKRELKLTILAHTGIINSDTAIALKNAGVDAALIDIIGSDETIRKVTNLCVTVKDYENSLRALQNANIAFTPHVIVGLHYGRLMGEFKALEMISGFKPKSLVIIAFMPIRGTEMEHVEPPKPIDIARTILIARQMFPTVPLALGCMRPRGKHRAETDILSINAGINAIAFPSQEAITYAQENGYQTTFSSVCCSQIYMKGLERNPSSQRPDTISRETQQRARSQQTLI